MLCNIAELYVEVPETGGLAPRCQDYCWSGEPDAEVISIKEEDYEPEYWPGVSYNTMCYLESGHLFDHALVKNSGMRIHASAIAWEGKAYLFSAPCGTGKSTHRQMWQQLYGEDAIVVFNDDKPALRLLDGKWYAFGTPWCGKEGINRNVKVPLAGICFLQQGPENKIRRLSTLEILPRVTDQTVWRMDTHEELNMLMGNLDQLIQKIPIFLLECTPTTDAAKLSSETMSKAANEAGL